MKTVRDVVKLLPKDVRFKFIQNCREGYLDTELSKLFKPSDMSPSRAALQGGFFWFSTKEGHEYWEEQIEKVAPRWSEK